MQDKQKPKKRRAVWIAIIVILIVVGAAAILFHLRRGPRHERAYRRGMLQLRGRNPREAIPSFRAALELHPDFMDAQLGIVGAYSDLDEFEKAFEEIDAAVKMGLSADRAAQIRANVHHAAAKHRMSAPAASVTPEFYDTVIRENISPAITDLTRCAESAEQPAIAYTLLGHMYKQLSETLLRKLTLLTEEREVASSLEEPERAVAVAKQMAVAEAQSRGAQLAMLAAYHNAIEKDPDTVDARLASAEHFLALTPPLHDEARERLGPILSKAAGNMRLLSLMERIERLSGNDEVALGYARSLRKLDPESSVIEITELSILMDCGLWDEAGPLAEGMASRQPNDSEIAYLHARWLLHQGKAADAEKTLQNAVLQEPDRMAPRDRFWRPQACKLYADVLVTNNKREQAIAVYEQGIRTVRRFYRPGFSTSQMSGELRSLLYECYKALSRETFETAPDKAVEHAVSAFEVFPDHAEAYDIAKTAFAETGRSNQVTGLARKYVQAVARTQGNEAGISTCRKQMRSLGNPPELRMLEANLLTRDGSYREALEALRRLRQDFPDHLGYARAMAFVHTNLGQNVEARRIFESLYESDPANPKVLRALLSLQMRTGQMDKARDLLVMASGTLGENEAQKALLDMALSEGHLDEAIRLAQEYVNADPRNAVAHSILGELLWQTGDLGKARASFDEALALKPTHLPAYRSGLIAMQEGRFKMAVEFYSTAAERLPVDYLPQMSVRLAVALASDGQVDKAAETLNALGLKDLPPDVRLDIPRWILTMLLVAQGQTDAAAAQNERIVTGKMGYTGDRQALLSRVAELPPDARQDAASTMSRFYLFAENRCPAAARAALGHLIELMPDEPLLLSWKAGAVARSGQYEEAIALFKTVLSNNPSLMVTRTMLADTYAQQGEYAMAVTALEKALPITSGANVPLLYFKLGPLQKQLGRWDDAIESFKRAMAHPAVKAEACNELALILATSKANPAEAVPYAERALRLMPNNAAIEDTLGWVLLLDGDTEGAMTHLERAKTLLPRHPVVRFHLAKAYIKAGKTTEAKEELQEALAISRSFPEAEEATQLLSEL